MENIALIFGGRSAEHEVSIISALQILNGITKEEFNILPIFLDKFDNWFLCEKDICLKDFSNLPLNNKFRPIVLKVGENAIYDAKKIKKPIIKIDACILATHGGIGENGKLVAFLEMCNIPVSSTSIGQAIGFDKVITKLVCKSVDIPVLDSVWFYKKDWKENPLPIIDKIKALKFPVIVKPCRQGSSIGISVCEDTKALIDAVAVALEFDNKVLVEKKLNDFKEFNCSALGGAGQEVIVSGVDEPTKIHSILSFEDKYVSGEKCVKKQGTKTGSMANMRRKFLNDGKIVSQIQTITKNVINLLDLSGVVRVDFLFDKIKKRVYLNEVNTVPGSLAFYFWCEQNIDINELVSRLVNIAKENFNQRVNLKNEYITKLL